MNEKHRMESEEIRMIHCFYLTTSLWSMLRVYMYIRLNIEWEGDYEYWIWKAEEILTCELD
jgi:hypothetical protein